MRFPLKNTYTGASFLSVLFFILFAFSAFDAKSQYSNLGFSFQGYAIDGEGKALSSKGVTVKFTVYRTGVSYEEEHALTTDAYGVFVANVGKGTPIGSVIFGSLDFNNFDFSLKVEVKETVGGTYSTISDKALQAVPYARSASNGVPVGTVVPFAGPSSNIPSGWLLCDGTTLNATSNPQYAQLFATIGTTWGGTGVTSFNVPDLRGMFLRGVNGTRSDAFADVQPTRAIGSTQWYQTALPGTQFTGATGTDGSHAHNYNQPNIGSFSLQSNTSDFATRTKEYVTDNGGTTTSNGSHSHWVGINGGGDAETSPKNVAVHYIIKY